MTERIYNPCWECLKGRHLNCQGVEHRGAEPCDCPHPADQAEGTGLAYDADRGCYYLDAD